MKNVRKDTSATPVKNVLLIAWHVFLWIIVILAEMDIIMVSKMETFGKPLLMTVVLNVIIRVTLAHPLIRAQVVKMDFIMVTREATG